MLLVANVAKEHVNKFHIPTIKMLLGRGWQVDVACRMDEEINACTNNYDLPISRSPFHTKWIKAYKTLRQIIENGEYDIVYCHTSVGATLARLASKKARKGNTKVIKFAHGTYFYKHAPWYNWLYYPLYKYLAKLTDVIITITDEDFQFSKRHFKPAAIYKVNGIGIDLSRFDKEIPPESKVKLRKDLLLPQDATVLIYCAELIKNKNQQLLIKALKKVLESKNDVYLVLVGPDHYNGKYQKMAWDLEVADHVRFLGWRKDIPELYKMADICVASSIREGFGLNIVEAMYCGLPIVASNNSGHNSIIRDGENGFLIELGDHITFSERILQLSYDTDLKKRITDSASQLVQQYGSEEIVKNLYNIFINNL